MKKLILSIFLLIFTNTLLAQNDFHYSKDSDTTFWYGIKNKYAKQFKLGLIENDTSDYLFRFWSFGLVVKVSGDSNNYLGEITRFVEEYPKDTKSNVFIKKYPITPSNVMQIRQLIDSLKIEDLPSDRNIKGWSHGFDGIEYLTEYKKGNKYSFKNYWTPNSQDTLKEAIQFLNFVSELERILDLNTNSKQFLNDIPFSGWSYPGSATGVLRIKAKAKKKNGG